MFTIDQKYFSNLENDGLNHNIGKPRKPVTAKSSTKIRNLERRICTMGLGSASAFFSDEELEVNMCLTTSNPAGAPRQFPVPIVLSMANR